MNRREFMMAASAAALAPVSAFARKPEEFRAMLFHWGICMWGEWLPEGVKELTGGRRGACSNRVKFSDEVWNSYVDRMVARKMNLVVVDLGEFPVYPSHPELAIPGSRSPEWVLKEVRRLKSLGLEPIPKLNFSAAHDAWLKDYSHMLTTRKYREVCRDVIRDAYEMFDRPRFMHIGYDEELPKHQHGFICVRTDEIWWNDFLFFVKTVEDLGMRPWMWSDYGWHHADFVAKCPKSVVQNNWYYDGSMLGFDMAKMQKDSSSWKTLNLFLELDKAGFDQVPCSSNWVSKTRRAAGVTTNDEAMKNTVDFCRAHLSPEHLKGFLMAPWGNSEDTGELQTRQLNGIDQLADAMG
ncbi:MAG: hypothetical protein IJH50_10610 [Kiritimatiellae bacterium]|nr:hypothetical protein [Kiritimatiellia bacterium]